MQKVISITIKGRIPSKKNSRNIFFRRGRMMNIPSPKYTAWHKASSLQLKKVPKYRLESVPSIFIEFYAPDRRATDLTNKAESIMDLLVDNEIIKDDNWYIVPRLALLFKGVDKLNPRAIIQITLAGGQ